MTNMKRALSDSESDCEFDDDKSGCNVGHGVDRKKRRGIIEKRRRDRINNSLSELRRLVPAAYEKQGSAKLEKAEILQMTVDHLKCLHAKGLNGYNIDTAALAVDYRGVGFRECVAEVARYMVSMEGMDVQDPLRLRLLSHLQCYQAQREAAAKASLSNSGWPATSSHLSAAHAHAPPAAPAQAYQMPGLGQEHMSAAAMASSYPEPPRHMAQGHGDMSAAAAAAAAAAAMRLPPAAGPQMASTTSSSSSSSQSVLGLAHSYPSLSMNSMSGMLSPSAGHYSSAAGAASLGKPYRPWGTELAY